MPPDQSIAAVMPPLSAEPGATVFPVIAAGGAMVKYPVTTKAGDRPLCAVEAEGKTVIRGRVDVTGRHDSPAGQPTGASFAVLKATGQSPAPDPRIYLRRGPGALWCAKGRVTCLPSASARNASLFPMPTFPKGDAAKVVASQFS